MTSCVSHWRVVRAADPNPMIGHQWFKMTTIDYSQLNVDNMPEAIFTAQMDAFQLEDWQSEKKAIQSNFTLAFQVYAGDYSIQIGDAGDYTLRPSIMAIETGPYQFPAHLAVARIHLRLEIIDTTGKTIDEIWMSPGFPWDFFNSKRGDRLRGLATELGTRAGEYLVGRAIQH